MPLAAREKELVLVPRVCYPPIWEHVPQKPVSTTADRRSRLCAAVGLPQSWSSGCLGEVIAKMDDDDVYGAHYLGVQLAALRYSNADLVGKQAHYLHIRGRDIVICRFPEREHRFTDLVMGPTLMTHRSTLLDNPVAERTLGEDTELQQRLIASGARIYSADRFNFVQVRGPCPYGASRKSPLANGDVHASDTLRPLLLLRIRASAPLERSPDRSRRLRNSSYAPGELLVKWAFGLIRQ